MLTYFEERKRTAPKYEIYKVCSWYLFGFILVFRKYIQLTSIDPLPSER